MTPLDYAVLFVYFAIMAGIGFWSMRRTKKQEDYFMGGRRFGKLLQTFAAFGAGTGSADPVNTARTTFTSGMSGMWSVMYWLFVTPIYWISGVWYRRMRCLTLGDWFVERYESKPMGVVYTIFGLVYYMVYASMLFSAIGKVAAPLMGDTVTVGGEVMGVEYLLVPVIAIIVILYGVLGGLSAAYWTDLIQGLLIILLSVMLVPFGLKALVEKFGMAEDAGMWSGFRILHEQLPDSFFAIVGAGNASEFPLHFIVAVTLINLIGIVVTPHFIATGGGSAKSENAARIGLVTGNLLKRFCTIGWVLTALIVVALFSDSPELQADPDKTWGIATKALLPAGLVGLMLACLLAALMSSADCYMLVCAALVVRNVYAPYFRPNASEREYVTVGRIAGLLVIVGAVAISWSLMDVFAQLQLTWIVPMLFAAPFWVGMYWRKATTTAAWVTVTVSALVFFVLPWLIPAVLPDLREDQRFTRTNQRIESTVERQAAPSDVARRQVMIDVWEQQRAEAEALQDNAERESAIQSLGPAPEPLTLGDTITETFTSGGRSIFWSGDVQPKEGTEGGYELVEERTFDGRSVRVSEQKGEWVGRGQFRLEMLLYWVGGMDLERMTNASLATLDLPAKIAGPFLVMIAVSWFTRRNSKPALDRFYVKMKTPVQPQRDRDREELERSYREPARFESSKLFPRSDIEIQRPSLFDVGGFLVTVALCFAVIGLAMWVARLGA